jgi:hypothetical protein
MTLLLGGFVSRLSTGDLIADIQQGREWLVQVTGQDFGFDAWRWHAYLRASDEGGYRWSNKHLGMPRRIAEATHNPEWRAAIHALGGDPEQGGPPDQQGS